VFFLWQAFPGEAPFTSSFLWYVLGLSGNMKLGLKGSLGTKKECSIVCCSSSDEEKKFAHQVCHIFVSVVHHDLVDAGANVRGRRKRPAVIQRDPDVIAALIIALK
jgi:hypothetical protein